MRCRNCWFSLQTNSIGSSSGTTRWLMRSVTGFVSAFASSMVTSISSLPNIGRRKRSVNFAWPLYGVPRTSSHPSY